MSSSDSVKVSVHNGTVTIELPLRLVRERLGSRRKRRLKADWSILKTTQGLWRHRKVDGLRYQREVRQEWEPRSPQ